MKSQKTLIQMNKTRGRQCQNEKLQNLMQKIQDLSQVQDQSRNEQVPNCFDQNSMIKDQDSLFNTDHLLVGLQNLSKLSKTSISEQQFQPIYPSFAIKNGESNNKKQKCQQIKRDTTIYQCRQQANRQQKQQLIQTNNKLVCDNKKLFLQCIRLRKHFNQLNIPPINPSHQYLLRIQLLQRQINKLNQQQIIRQNNHQQKLKRIHQQYKVEYCTLGEMFNEVKKENLQLIHRLKIIQAEKLHDKMNQSRCHSATTLESRNIYQTPNDNDRYITNIKIVHQAQIKKLKDTIQQQQNQIKQLNQMQPLSKP